MKIIAKNRRAWYDYEIIDRFIAGIVLSGQEVKSIKSGGISLKGSFVHFQNGEAYLVNAHVRAYRFASGLADYTPTQSRKLLLHSKEIEILQTAKRSAGLAVVPLAVGLERGFIKIEIASARGRKRYDKRQAAKKRAMQKDASLEVKSRKTT